MADLWLVGEMVNRIGIYGSKVAEGLSAFQRRSCSFCDSACYRWIYMGSKGCRGYHIDTVNVLSWGWCVDNQSIHVVHSRCLIISNPQSGGIVQSKHTSRLPQALLHQSASTGQRPSHSSQYYPRSAFSHICTLPLMHTHISRSACQIIQVSLIPLTCIGLSHISDK